MDKVKTMGKDQGVLYGMIGKYRWWLLLFWLAAVCPGARAFSEEAKADLLPGMAVELRTASISSFDRFYYSLSQSLSADVHGVEAGRIDIDAIMRQQQETGLLPSFGTSYLQMLTGMATAEFDNASGVAFAIFASDETEMDESPLGIVVWLPLKNFASLYNAASKESPALETGNIRRSEEVEGALEVVTLFDDGAGGKAVMYLKPVERGAIFASSKGGLLRGDEWWGEKPPATVRVASGFRAEGRGDFSRDGFQARFANSLNMHAIARQVSGSQYAAFIVPLLFKAMIQGDGGDFELNARVNGNVELRMDLIARRGSELSAFLGDGRNRAMSPGIISALPENMALVLAASGGVKEGNFVADLVDSMTKLIRGHDTDSLFDAASIMAGMLLAMNDDGAALGLGADAGLYMTMATGSPENAQMVAESLSGKVDYVAAAAKDKTVVAAYGHGADGMVETLKGNLTTGSGRRIARRELREAIAAAPEKGILVAVVYPSDLMRLAMTNRFKEIYRIASERGGGEVDQFSASIMKRLATAADGMPPSRYGVRLIVLGDADKLSIRVGGSLAVVTETMQLHQRLVFALLPNSPDLMHTH